MRTNREKSDHYLAKAEGDLTEQVYARGTLSALLAVAYAIHALSDDLEGQDREELAALVEQQEAGRRGRGLPGGEPVSGHLPKGTPIKSPK